jgi:hypothetical protein
MKPPRLVVLIASSLLGCARNPSPPLVPVQNDSSIVFPQFFEAEARAVGTEGQLYEVDGAVLSAVAVAASDFLHPADQGTPCRSRREAQLYRVIRQQNVVFVYIHENPAYCGHISPSLDSGVKYAISTDGHILRRVMDGQEGGPFDNGPPRQDDAGFIGEPGTSPTFDALLDGGVQTLDSGASDASR